MLSKPVAGPVPSVLVTAPRFSGRGGSGLVGGHLVECRLDVLHEELELPHDALGRLLRPVVDQHDVLGRQLPQLHVLVAHLFRRAHDPQALELITESTPFSGSNFIGVVPA